VSAVLDQTALVHMGVVVLGPVVRVRVHVFHVTVLVAVVGVGMRRLAVAMRVRMDVVVTVGLGHQFFPSVFRSGAPLRSIACSSATPRW
jgi:hypothetical protein